MANAYDLDTALQVKIHINLPANSWDIITDDIATFSADNKVTGYSNFVNYIINYYIENKRYPACFDSKLKVIDNNIKELCSFFNNLDKKAKSKATQKDISLKSLTKEQVEIIRASYIKDLINETIEKYNSYPKGEAKKIDLNKAAKENFNSMRQLVKITSSGKSRGIEETHIFSEIFDAPSVLARAILIDYTSLSHAERCKICKYDICDKIDRSIKEKRSIRVSFFDNNEYITVIPYGIVTDKYSIHSYLVGLYEDKASRNAGAIVLREISRIKKVVGENDHMTLSKDEKANIKADILAKGVENLLANKHICKVKFTKGGISKYNKLLYQRPIAIDIDKDNDIYTFNCTKFELIKYFRRFGQDAIIISPSDVHEDMLKEYKKAVEAYSKCN